MKYTGRTLLLIAMMIMFADVCCAESLQVTSTPTPTSARRGETVAMSINLKNVLTPREPIVITAQVEWEDEYGVANTSTASATINVVQPVKVTRYKVAIPALFAFVAGSAKVDGQPIAATSSDGVLVLELNRTLSEGELVTLDYSMKAN